jgi:hypothetical protein
VHNDTNNSSRPDPDFPDLSDLTFVEREYAQPILLTLAAAPEGSCRPTGGKPYSTT